jgi:phosphohistidine phosphatase
MRTKPDYYYAQSAVIPYRRRLLSRRLEVCLITNRRGTRWIVPKGVVEPGLSPAESAAKEAWEEAGLRGEVQVAELGRYRYRKWGDECEVSVYPMRVTETLRTWPESHRRRRWVPLAQAVAEIGQEPLRALLQKLAERAGR